MTDHSQCGESTWILENLKPEVGTFCEVGAFDGIQSSNTLLFEQLGWSGILVEADPFLAAQCHKNRKAMTWCCACAFNLEHDGYDVGFFNVNEKDRGLSGIYRPGKQIPMVFVNLFDILLKSGFHRTLDLLSIDTEGTELDVWKSIGEIRPRIVIMEYQTCDEPPQDKAIVDQMTKDGYTEVHRTQYNLIFTRN